MATNFRNIVGKDIGTQRVAVYTTPSATSTTIIGMNLANTTTGAIATSVTLINNDGDSCFVVKNAPIASGG